MLTFAALLFAPLFAQAAAAQSSGRTTPSPLAPSEIVAAAPAAEWVTIAPSDLLVMELAPGPRGPRRVVIQLIPAPFSQGWVSNIRALTAARFWDGTSINRVQDNYVVQWGDASEKKPLPAGLAKMRESQYQVAYTPGLLTRVWREDKAEPAPRRIRLVISPISARPTKFVDPYSEAVAFAGGFPLGLTERDELISHPDGYTRAPREVWPVHCYGMVGVGRNLSPDTGTGAELYTVIGHAPRHLDRNIALVGRVIEGIEHLSSLPRGTGALGFYEKPEGRTAIVSVRIGSTVSGLPAWQYLSTESDSFTRYADARANRRDDFFIRPAGGADVCNIPVPVRRRP